MPRAIVAAAPMLAAMLVGCVKYHAHPLDPAATEQQFRARTLSDPGLRAFLHRTDWPPARLGLNDLIGAALYFNPDLDVARTQFRTAQAAIVTAKARPNPALSTGGGYETDPESHLLFNLLPSFTVITAGKRTWRTLEAEKSADAARVGVEEAAWKVESRVRTAWLDYLMAHRSLDLLRQERGVHGEIVEMLDRRVAAGDASRPEADAERAALLSLDVASQTAQTQVDQAGAALAAAVGVPQLPQIDTEALPSLPASLPLGDVQKAGLLHRADIRRSLLEYAAADAALHLEIANQYPDFQYSPGYSFNEGFHQFSFGSALNVPLLNRNRGPIAEAEARRSEAEARFNALQAQAIGEMQVALASYNGALAELDEADNHLMRNQRDREAAMQRAFQLGDQDRLALAGVRAETAVVALARLDAYRRAKVALGALEDSLQHSLEAGAPLPDPVTKP